MPTLPLPHVHSHIQHFVFHKSPFKIAKRKIQLSPNSMVSGLCSVLINEWDQLRIQGWDFLPELQGQDWAGFDEQMDALFACPPAETILYMRV
jgi:hypothetical protein